MVSNDEISRMLRAKRRGEDPKKVLGKIRDNDGLKNGNVCSRCSTQNPTDADFCMECGEKLVQQIESSQNTSNIVSNKNEKIERNPATTSGEFSTPEKKGIHKGVRSGTVIMAVSGIMFIVGLIFLDRIYFFLPLLFIIGLFVFIKGLSSGNS